LGVRGIQHVQKRVALGTKIAKLDGMLPPKPDGTKSDCRFGDQHGARNVEDSPHGMQRRRGCKRDREEENQRSKVQNVGQAWETKTAIPERTEVSVQHGGLQLFGDRNGQQYTPGSKKSGVMIEISG
jgi:hypothetical protein